MKIRYVAPIDKTVASHRYRVLIPASILSHEGHEVTVGRPERGLVNVYTKHFNREEMLAGIKETGGVFDICDDHFRNTSLYDYYFDMCREADHVTCNSFGMSRIIDEETGRLPTVIPDPYEFHEMPPRFHDLSMGLWFGGAANMKDLKDIELDCDLEVVSAFKCSGKDGHVRQTPWSLEAMDVAFRRNEFAIFPAQKRTRKNMSKSRNRLVNAIRSGMLCFCQPNAVPDELDKYCIISEDILGALREAREKDSAELVAIVEGGQEYVRKEYSPNLITQYWKGVFNEAEHRVRN